MHHETAVVSCTLMHLVLCSVTRFGKGLRGDAPTASSKTGRASPEIMRW